MRDVLLGLRGGSLAYFNQWCRGRGTLSPSSFGASTSDGIASRAGTSVAICSRMATAIIYYIVHRRLGESSPRRYLRRYCDVESQSAGLGGLGTVVPLAGAKDVPGTT
ncbi:UNVERIFIED_CONTAM: hypothetical protein Sradi_4510600 [Sesamum radiatum]|uniref:Uncharacterized protein n=1 Tax=Sesamum radiatum TaxID=300843 RepID=A0AAW2NA72_SESRA